MIRPLTKEDLLRLWGKLFPESYTAPIKEDGDGRGLDIFSQQAAQFARVAKAIDTTTQAMYLLPHSTQTSDPASGGVKAQGEITVRVLSTSDVGDIVLPAGALLDSYLRNIRGAIVAGPRFVLLDAVTIPTGTFTSFTARVEAEREGYHGNIQPYGISQFSLMGRSLVEGAKAISANQVEDLGVPDRFNASMIGRYVAFKTGPNISNQRRKIVAVSDGSVTTVTLDGPALTFPSTGNVEVLEYSDLGLVISQPLATSGGKNAFLEAIGDDRGTGRTPGETDEIYRQRIAALADTISPAAIQRIATRILSPHGIAFRIQETRDFSGLRGFVLDDDALDDGETSIGNILVDARGNVRYFLVTVGPGHQGEIGGALDDVALDDVALDGSPVEYDAVIASLYQAINDARASGFSFDILGDPTL